MVSPEGSLISSPPPKDERKGGTMEEGSIEGREGGKKEIMIEGRKAGRRREGWKNRGWKEEGGWME